MDTDFASSTLAGTCLCSYINGCACDEIHGGGLCGNSRDDTFAVQLDCQTAIASVGTVLHLERSITRLKGGSMEHLAQRGKVRHANMGLGGVQYTT